MKIRTILLLLFAVLQVSWIGLMINSHERTLAEGRPVKFRTAPLDPADPFRGRYVRLRIWPSYYESPKELDLSFDQPIYALLSLDAEGFAEIGELVDQRPEDPGVLYLTLKRCWGGYRQMPPTATEGEESPTRPAEPRLVYYIEYPFDRYYMNEDAAPEAERIYAAQARRPAMDDEPSRDDYVVVRIRDGDGVIEQLYLRGQPVEELLHKP